MHLPSNLSYQTDFIFHQRDGLIEEHEDYWVIRTPNNPSFWFGNFILFRRAPRGENCLHEWMAIQDVALGASPHHRVFGWDEPVEGDLSAFLAAGFETSHGMSLTLTDPPAQPQINEDLSVRRIQRPEDWEAVLQQQVQVSLQDFGHPDDGGEFLRRQLSRHREVSVEQRGNWWGAFDGETLVGNMGLFFDLPNQVGRFQNVATSRAHRRQRVCTTLLHHIVQHAFEEVGADRLVICTGSEDDNPAVPTYQNFGFTYDSPHYALKRVPTADGSKPDL